MRHYLINCNIKIIRLTKPKLVMNRHCLFYIITESILQKIQSIWHFFLDSLKKGKAHSCLSILLFLIKVFVFFVFLLFCFFVFNGCSGFNFSFFCLVLILFVLTLFFCFWSCSYFLLYVELIMILGFRTLILQIN